MTRADLVESRVPDVASDSANHCSVPGDSLGASPASEPLSQSLLVFNVTIFSDASLFIPSWWY